MSKNNRHNPENIAFEMLVADESSVVFQRKASNKKKKAKELKRIKLNQPTATLHYFSHEDFERLKQIEADITAQVEHQKPTFNFFAFLFKFLEIK